MVEFPIKVGRFTMIEEGLFSGPGDYMRERFHKCMDEIESGSSIALQSIILAEVCNGESSSPQEKVLKALQLDCADWHGVKSLLRSM